MKKVLFAQLLSCLLVISGLYSQTIDGDFNYQAVVRDASGNPIANQEVSMLILIHLDAPTGNTVFSESHQLTTNGLGLVNLIVGEGDLVSGDLNIDWLADQYFLEVKFDPAGGTNYQLMGNTRILGVPLATSAQVSGGIRSMTEEERDQIESPFAGMQIFNLTSHRINYFDGYNWFELVGNQLTFTCGDPFTDSRDGKMYSTIQIGQQCWMASNLNYGSMIPGSDNQSDNGIAEKYCYANDEPNCDTYGGLYQWNEMMAYTTTAGIQGICPEDWHLPTNSEWQTLVNASGGMSQAGGNLQQGGASGFNGEMGGFRNNTGGGYPFLNVGQRGYFWTSDMQNTSFGEAWYIINNQNPIYQQALEVQYGFSVRCVHD